MCTSVCKWANEKQRKSALSANKVGKSYISEEHFPFSIRIVDLGWCVGNMSADSAACAVVSQVKSSHDIEIHAMLHFVRWQYPS